MRKLWKVLLPCSAAWSPSVQKSVIHQFCSWSGSTYRLQIKLFAVGNYFPWSALQKIFSMRKKCTVNFSYKPFSTIMTLKTVFAKKKRCFGTNLKFPFKNWWMYLSRPWACQQYQWMKQSFIHRASCSLFVIARLIHWSGSFSTWEEQMFGCGSGKIINPCTTTIVTGSRICFLFGSYAARP